MSWPSVSIAELGKISTGSTPKTSDSRLWGGDTPFVTPSELGHSEPIIAAKRYLSAEGVSSSRLAPEGAVLVCCIGSLGKTGYAGRPIVTNQQINWIDFDVNKVFPRYGYYACERLGRSLIFHSASTTIPIINKSKFSELHIPLPPLDEQRRIAAILDKADALRRKRKRIVELFRSIPQSLFLQMFGDPQANSGRWNRTSALSDVADIGSGITKGRKEPSTALRRVPYLAVANVQDRALDLTTVKTIEASEEEICRFRLKSGDLVLTEGGDPDKLGRGTVWRDELPEAIHQNHIFRVRVDIKEIDPVYLNFLIGSEYGKRYFLRSAKQTTGIASINKSQLSRFPVLLPPVELQKKFSLEVGRLEILRGRADQSNEAMLGLFDSIQHDVFSGQL